MEQKLKSNNRGITLIALIITIIVLLILAVVAISAIKGDGIIAHAQNAKTQYSEAQDNEQILLALTEWKIVEAQETKTFEKFMQEKFGEDNITTVNENEVIVTMESGKKYNVTIDGTITSIKGVSINKSSLTLELQEGTTVTEILTASLSDITGEIKWNNSDNTKVTISSTKGESITITAVAVGTTTITATCGNHTATCTVTVKKTANVTKGAFVEYKVAYKDAYKGYDYTTNGWRLLDYTENADGTYSNVKIISTGVPAMLYYYHNDTTNSSWYVTDSTKLTNFRNVLGSDYQFYTSVYTYYSLQAAAGMYYNFGDIKFAYGTSNRGKSLGYFTEITSNGTTYNSANTTETTASKLFIPTGVNAEVRLLTLPEMNTMLERTDTDSVSVMTDPTGTDGLFILQNIKNITGMSSNTYDFCYYWLASPWPNAKNSTSVCYLNASGNVTYGYNNNIGVRPVIFLTSNVQITDNGNGVLKID